MKKIASFVVLLAILFNCCAGYASVNFNADDYTADELAQIYSIVSEKVCGCVKIPAGIYVVGKDFPAGTYTVLSNNDVKDNSSNDFAHAAIFASMDEYNKDPQNFFDDDSLAVMACNTLWSGMSCEMTDGMVLAIKFGTIGLSKVNSNVFSSFWN